MSLAQRTARFLGAGVESRAAFTSLLSELRAALGRGEHEAVGESIARAALPTLDYTSATSLAG